MMFEINNQQLLERATEFPRPVAVLLSEVRDEAGADSDFFFYPANVGAKWWIIAVNTIDCVATCIYVGESPHWIYRSGAFMALCHYLSRNVSFGDFFGPLTFNLKKEDVYRLSGYCHRA